MVRRPDRHLFHRADDGRNTAALWWMKRLAGTNKLSQSVVPCAVEVTDALPL